MQGLQWEHDWANSGQSKDRASGNKRNVFLMDKKQETKASPLGDGADHHKHMYLDDACAGSCGTRPSSQFARGGLLHAYGAGRVRPSEPDALLTEKLENKRKTNKEGRSECHGVSSSSAWLRPQAGWSAEH